MSFSAKVINSFNIDVNAVKLSEIDGLIDKYILEYNIIGLKLHPNLQNFYPQPSDNPPATAEKLRRIYRVATERNLYLLFHSGTSFFPKEYNSKVVNLKRSRHKGLLKNFYNENAKKSEIFDVYNTPIVLAHLGHYGALRLNHKLIKTLTKRYDNVYFDTSGQNPLFIGRAIDIVGSEKILFGSDGLYNRMEYNLLFLYHGIKKFNSLHLENSLLNILQRNFLTILDRQKNF